MEHSTDITEMIEKIMCPAFTVEQGIITHVNQSALQLNINQDASVSDLIAIGADEYTQYTDGKLCLTLCIHDIMYSATVTTTTNCHIFCLSSDYEEPELRAFALAALQLREPLSSAMLSAEELLPNSIVQNNDEVMEHLSQINRSLHQLLRAVTNMSDTAHYTAKRNFRMQMQDIVAVFHEILEKATCVLAQSKRIINYSLPKQPVYCLADPEKLERAALNLLSNAIKNTPNGGIIDVNLSKRNNKLFFTVQDNGNGIDPKIKSNVFSRFLREPGISDGYSGIGLGLSIVRSIAAAHNGTLLMEQCNESGAKFTMTIGIVQTADSMVRTPILLPVDYAGGRDHVLLELSDILPNTLYENIP